MVGLGCGTSSYVPLRERRAEGLSLRERAAEGLVVGIEVGTTSYVPLRERYLSWSRRVRATTRADRSARATERPTRDSTRSASPAPKRSARATTRADRSARATERPTRDSTRSASPAPERGARATTRADRSARRCGPRPGELRRGPPVPSGSCLGGYIFVTTVPPATSAPGIAAWMRQRRPKWRIHEDGHDASPAARAEVVGSEICQLGVASLSRRDAEHGAPQRRERVSQEAVGIGSLGKALLSVAFVPHRWSSRGG